VRSAHCRLQCFHYTVVSLSCAFTLATSNLPRHLYWPLHLCWPLTAIEDLASLSEEDVCFLQQQQQQQQFQHYTINGENSHRGSQEVRLPVRHRRTPPINFPPPREPLAAPTTRHLHPYHDYCSWHPLLPLGRGAIVSHGACACKD
jgi:hypothetical protein